MGCGHSRSGSLLGANGYLSPHGFADASYRLLWPLTGEFSVLKSIYRKMTRNQLFSSISLRTDPNSSTTKF